MGAVAVLGAGYWGPNLVRNFLTLGAYEAVIVSDLNARRVERVCRRFPGVEGLTDPVEVFKRKDVEAVLVATPVDTHYELAKAALEAGKHVLVEKPMTRTSAQARELVDLAESRGLTLMVDHVFVFSGPVEKIHEIVSRGGVGDVYYLDSVRVNLGLFREDVNVVWDLAPHDLSIAMRLLGRGPQSIRAFGRRHAGHSMVDVAYIHADYGEGVTATFHVNWLSPTKIRRMVVAGSQRMILWDDLDVAEKVRVYDKGVELFEVDEEERTRLKVGYRTGDVWMPRIENAEPLAKLARHFVECSRKGAKPLASGLDGLRVVLALEACDLSIENDRPVVIEGERLRLA